MPTHGHLLQSQNKPSSHADYSYPYSTRNSMTLCPQILWIPREGTLRILCQQLRSPTHLNISIRRSRTPALLVPPSLWVEALSPMHLHLPPTPRRPQPSPTHLPAQISSPRPCLKASSFAGGGKSPQIVEMSSSGNDKPWINLLYPLPGP